MLDNDITPAKISPRGKRERIANHYQKALHGLVNYFDAPESVIEFIEAALLHHGYSEDEWTATGAELAWSLAPASTTDQHDRIRDRLAKQRERLATWQETKDSNGLSRPVLVAIRAELEQVGKDKKWRYWYSLPIAGLVAKVVEIAPVGAGSRRIRTAIATTAKEYLRSTGLRPPSKVATRKHTPASQIKRGLAYLEKGIEAANRSENDVSKTVKNALFENDKLLKIIELLNRTVGIILTVSDGDFPANMPMNDDAGDDLTAQSSAYSFINIYAQNDDGGAAGRGVTARASLSGLEVAK